MFPSAIQNSVAVYPSIDSAQQVYNDEKPQNKQPDGYHYSAAVENLTNGVIYYYSVECWDESGNSAKTTPLSIQLIPQ